MPSGLNGPLIMLSDIMLHGIMLCVIILCDIMIYVIMLSAVLPSTMLLSLIIMSVITIILSVIMRFVVALVWLILLTKTKIDGNKKQKWKVSNEIIDYLDVKTSAPSPPPGAGGDLCYNAFLMYR